MKYQTFDYERYNVVETRIRQFNRFNVIGKDSSGSYDMYSIELGTDGKPPILITAGVHGQETEVTQYSLSFMEDLRDDNFPDSDFRDYLLENFLIVYIPVLNPWGMDNIPDPYIRIGSDHYRNINQVDINRDFVNQSQAETRNVVNVMNRYDYFAHLDLHMMYPGYNLVNDENFVVANESNDSKPQQNEMADEWETFTGSPVRRWDLRPARAHMVRGYSIDKPNPYTPYTLPMMTEIMRPVWWNGVFTEYLTNEEIFYSGYASLYSFFKMATKFYDESTEEVIPEIPHIPDDLEVGTFISRNDDGLTESMIQRRDKRETSKIFIRNNFGYVTRVETETKDI